jgi:hypothetical protein
MAAFRYQAVGIYDTKIRLSLDVALVRRLSEPPCRTIQSRGSRSPLPYYGREIILSSGIAVIGSLAVLPVPSAHMSPKIKLCQGETLVGKGTPEPHRDRIPDTSGVLGSC